MKKYETTVPFDPGYSKISFSFMANISNLTGDFINLKTMHQKKFKLSQIEPKIIDMIVKSTAFYLGCLLWGGFLKSKFKNPPKEITGNYTLSLSDKEKESLDCAQETDFTLEYIKHFDRDCKYYLNKPAKIPEIIKEILVCYGEFARLNENFVNVRMTSDIKLPEALSHLEKMSEERLDELHDKIMAAIAAGKIENLLEIGFYKN